MTEGTEDRTPDRVAATAGGPVAAEEEPPRPPEAPKGQRRKSFLVAMAFLGPALVILGALVLYPIIFSVIRSLYDKSGNTFVGVQNYGDMFASDRTLTAIKNNVIWMLLAPSIITALGLIFAVLTERVRWGTAFKVAIFMPMAISFLSAGVTWRVVYQQEPEKGLLNAAIGGITNTFRSPGDYPGARPSQEDLLRPVGAGGEDEPKALATTRTFTPGETVNLGLVAINPELVPENATNARPPQVAPDALGGVVWLDFTTGGGGESGQVDPTEVGLPNVRVEALRGDEVVAEATTDADGAYVMEGLEAGDYTLQLAQSNFREAFGGVSWLGPTLVTPAIILAYIWMWAGFAMVVIGAGLAAIPRDVLEAARVDGASEWQVFRRVTVPLLAPVLAVVLVTLVINVLKIFDLVLVIAPGNVQDDANVIALEMWRTAFGAQNNQGLGSALAVFLFVLVVPAMLFNIRRFRAEQ
ncbi:MAG TPA: ABC transporter permease subunit [Actinomycetota bacterium]|nr:ABC transporter permease subunit [Actinomycetota bacterium]